MHCSIIPAFMIRFRLLMFALFALTALGSVKPVQAATCSGNITASYGNPTDTVIVGLTLKSDTHPGSWNYFVTIVADAYFDVNGNTIPAPIGGWPPHLQWSDSGSTDATVALTNSSSRGRAVVISAAPDGAVAANYHYHLNAQVTVGGSQVAYLIKDTDTQFFTFAGTLP